MSPIKKSALYFLPVKIPQVGPQRRRNMTLEFFLETRPPTDLRRCGASISSRHLFHGFPFCLPDSTNENAPRLIESWDARRTALPRSLLTNSLRFSARSGNGSEVLFTRLVRRSPKHPTNENAPDSLSHGTLVEQPSPEVCSPAGYDFSLAVGMAPKCYCGKLASRPA